MGAPSPAGGSASTMKLRPAGLMAGGARIQQFHPSWLYGGGLPMQTPDWEKAGGRRPRGAALRRAGAAHLVRYAVPWSRETRWLAAAAVS